MTDSEFREAYGRNKDILYRFAWRMTGSPTAAEDLVQDCFLVLLGNPEAFDSRRGTLRSFLIGVTRNLSLKLLRDERTFDELDDDDAACQPIDPDGLERNVIVARAVAALLPLQREALILAEYEELPLEEIARIVGAELAAVKSRLHRARENLRRMLAPCLDRKGIADGPHR
jgi:RNA polymerase sigma-70 factor (ECF subfamily)